MRLIGIRFQAGATTVTPTPLDFTLIQSWLGRAYPVASVEWSQVTVDGPSAWPFQAPEINAFVRAIRTADVAGGVDARTHYYGLVGDNAAATFMRGLASGIPTTADPTTVASGPCGGSTFGWDTDGSYGDWYTGHELGHTFGRFHAEFCGAGGGAPYPFTNGQLSNADGAFVGFDVGDIANGLPLRALPGTAWHDVMSYCVNQWISSFTYTGIRTRLVAEDGMAGAPLPAGRRRSGARRASGRGGAMPSGTIHVVATLNVTQRTGELRHVTPVAAIPPGQAALASGRPRRRARAGAGAGAAPTILLRVFGKGDALIAEYVAPFIPDACRDAGDDVSGSIDVFVPGASAATRLELLLDGVVVDTFAPAAAAPPAVSNIRAQRPGGSRRRGVVPARRAPPAPAVPHRTTTTPIRCCRGRRRCRLDAARARPRAAPAPGRRAGGPATGAATRYTVQVSVDGGSTPAEVQRDPAVIAAYLGDEERLEAAAPDPGPRQPPRSLSHPSSRPTTSLTSSQPLARVTAVPRGGDTTRRVVFALIAIITSGFLYVVVTEQFSTSGRIGVVVAGLIAIVALLAIVEPGQQPRRAHLARLPANPSTRPERGSRLDRQMARADRRRRRVRQRPAALHRTLAEPSADVEPLRRAAVDVIRGDLPARVPLRLKHGINVRVDFIYQRFSRKIQALIDFVGHLLSLVPYCLFAIWVVWDYAFTSLFQRSPRWDTWQVSNMSGKVAERRRACRRPRSKSCSWSGSRASWLCKPFAELIKPRFRPRRRRTASPPRSCTKSR